MTQSVVRRVLLLPAVAALALAMPSLLEGFALLG
jgi:hypothetical protein